MLDLYMWTQRECISNTHSYFHADILMQTQEVVKGALLSGCCYFWPADMEKVEIRSVTLRQEPKVFIGVWCL